MERKITVGGLVEEIITWNGKSKKVGLLPEFHSKFVDDGQFNERRYVEHARRCDALATTGVWTVDPSSIAHIDNYVTEVVILEPATKEKPAKRIECMMQMDLRKKFSTSNGDFDNDRYVKYLQKCADFAKSGR